MFSFSNPKFIRRKKGRFIIIQIEILLIKLTLKIVKKINEIKIKIELNIIELKLNTPKILGLIS